MHRVHMCTCTTEGYCLFDLLKLWSIYNELSSQMASLIESSLIEPDLRMYKHESINVHMYVWRKLIKNYFLSFICCDCALFSIVTLLSATSICIIKSPYSYYWTSPSSSSSTCHLLNLKRHCYMFHHGPNPSTTSKGKRVYHFGITCWWARF